MLAIVVLQHQRWRDTLACLQSLVPDVAAGLVRVIVVDNPGDTDACEPLELWMRGEGLVSDGATPVPLPDARPSGGWAAPTASHHAEWTLVRSTANDGFARGMNRGIRVALSDPRVTAVWLLNNDTVLRAGSVRAVVYAVAESATTVGQWGTMLLEWRQPDTIQCAGWCRWNRWLATFSPEGAGQRLAEWAPVSAPPDGDGYVYGASWVVRAAALRQIGLLDESAFLYGEELDWTERAKPSWSAALIPGAVVYHREGASIGAGAKTTARSNEVDRAGIDARLRLTRRFFRISLPGVYLAMFGAIVNRLRRGQPGQAVGILRALATSSPAPVRPAAPAASDPSA
jgi:GT2 family glycosyltransferase